MALKVKFRTKFPALVSALSPITLLKNGFSFAFGLDINALRTTLDLYYAGLSNLKTIEDFGASTINSAAVNTIAIQAAIDSRLPVWVPPKTYQTNTVNVTNGNTKIYGHHSGLSILTTAQANTPIINVAINLGNIEIADLGLTRSVVATVGGTGINFAGYVDTSAIRRCEIQKQYVGAVLRSTGYSWLENCYIHDNIADGIVRTNTATNGAVQWYTRENLIQGNGSRGIVTISVAGPPQVTVGDDINNYTFANSSFGMAFAGLPGVPIQGVRINGGFLGGDGNTEIYLDTYGGQHKINNVFMELAGTGLTGPGFATAASHIGSGIEITTNNIDVTITNPVVNGNSEHGIRTLASAMTNIVGARVANNSSFGVLIGDGTKAALTGTTFSNNTSGNLSVTSNSASLHPAGCFPDTLNVYPITIATTPVVSGSANGVLFTTAGGILASVTSVNNAIYTTTGAGAPQASAAGTGVLAALAVNVGAAGAPVLFNGALGSPSSLGTLPAHTLGGTISGGGNQINNVVIGASTPLAGTHTTIQANTSVNIGAAIAPDSILTVNANTGASVALGTVAQIHTIAADAAFGGITADVFGAQGLFINRHAGGTQASKTASASANTTFSFFAQHWDTAAYASSAGIDFGTINTQSASDHSGFLRVRTVATGATSLAERFRIQKGLTVGSSTTDPGANAILLDAQTFASLPAAAAALKGAMATVSDSTTVVWGATITGGGANPVLAFCNGTNWTVAGK